MSRLRYNRREAVAHLRKRGSGMDRLIAQGGPFKLRVARDNDLFRALSSAIIYQQLSGKAAAPIPGQFCALFDGGLQNAAGMGAVPMDALRGAGLSRNKALAVIDLAEKVESGALPSLRRMAGLDDDAVVERLCQVRGVGPWTAQMYLIFNLGRPDVMPATDLGIRTFHAGTRLQDLNFGKGVRQNDGQNDFEIQAKE